LSYWRREPCCRRPLRLTAGPLLSLGTPLTGYVTATESFESDLSALALDLGSSAATSLTPAQASTTALAETLAYQTDIHAALQMTHPNISNMVDQAVDALENAAISLATETSTVAQTDLQTATSAFDTAILDTNGVFGPKGVISVSLASGQGFSPRLTDTRAASSLASVSGTASFDGTATVTARLSSASGAAISGVPVSFILDGAFAGIAVTDSSGAATLAGIPTSVAGGTDTNGVVAYFAGDVNVKSSSGSGALTVAQAGTSVGSVSGTATGGLASLTATITSAVTGQGVSGLTVEFTLDGTDVGPATTDSNGVATLSNIATSDPVGTHPNAVAVAFAGNTSYTSSNGTGTLTVS
jgi:hypothetical protein